MAGAGPSAFATLRPWACLRAFGGPGDQIERWLLIDSIPWPDLDREGCKFAGRCPSAIEPQPISISIANDKVVGYTVDGAPFDVQYYRVTTKVSFGDRDHYFMTLERTTDSTASDKIHGRIGYGAVRVTRE